MLKLIIFSAFLIGSYALPNPESKIVNGTNAALGEFPYIVSIKNYASHNCGGSILDAKHVLTAAHCVPDGWMYSMGLEYEIIDINSHPHRSIITNAVRHELYDPEGGRFNDIAVITISSPIQFNDIVKPIVLPEQDEPTPEEATAVLAGWGLNQSNGTVMRYLQKVDLKVFTDEECEYLYDNVTNRKYNICGGIPEGGKGPCNGDSGGPLYAGGKQVGIVSWSELPCASKGYPGVFVKVSSYVDWIKKQIA